MTADITVRELAQFFSLCQDLLCIAGTDGMFKRLNPSWTRTLGWEIDELMARPYIEFIHPDDREATIREASALAAGFTTVAFENRYACRDGSYKWLQWTAILFAEDDRIYAIARDVTAVKETERALQAAHEKAERATLAKNVFLSRMSHELRTPLNAVLGFAQLLEMENLGGKVPGAVHQILKGGQHLLNLINEVLDIARIESGRLSLSPEPVSVGDIVVTATELVRPLAIQRDVTLAITPIPPTQLPVRADRQRLSQVLLNLLSNAIKYNHAGGQVSVDCATPMPGRTRINVRDTGSGIPAAKLALLFEPFERLGAEQTDVEGTGLGLALARGLAQAMGGSVGVESVVGEGSTFWVELATVDQEPAAVRPDHEAPSVEVATSAGIVLYIEDNLSNVELMRSVLQRRPGLTLLHAMNGRQGLALARERQPALILLDLHLPEASGEEVLRWLQDDTQCRVVPVVIVTADAMPGVSRRLKAAGATACLTKPIDVRAVLALLDNLLDPGVSTRGQVATDAR